MNVAVPLISAALAALVAWIVAVRQSRTSHEGWVRDKRHASYERIITAAEALTDAGLGLDEKVNRQMALLKALKAAELLAPKRIRDQADVVFGHMRAVEGGGPAGKPMLDALDVLLERLRDDLVPKHMR